MSNKHKLIGFLGIVALGYFVINSRLKNFDTLKQEVKQQYPSIDFKSPIDGTVESVYRHPKLRSSPIYVNINFTEGFKNSLHTSGHALDNSDIYIRDLSESGTKIKKEPNSDTLIVFFKNDIFRFLLANDE